MGQIWGFQGAAFGMRGQVKVYNHLPGAVKLLGLLTAEDEGLLSFPGPCGFVHRRCRHKHFGDETLSLTAAEINVLPRNRVFQQDNWSYSKAFPGAWKRSTRSCIVGAHWAKPASGLSLHAAPDLCVCLSTMQRRKKYSVTVTPWGLYLGCPKRSPVC